MRNRDGYEHGTFSWTDLATPGRILVAHDPQGAIFATFAGRFDD